MVPAVPKGLQERLRTVRRHSCKQLGSTRAITLEEFSGTILCCTEASGEGSVADYDVGHPLNEGTMGSVKNGDRWVGFGPVFILPRGRVSLLVPN